MSVCCSTLDFQVTLACLPQDLVGSVMPSSFFNSIILDIFLQRPSESIGHSKNDALFLPIQLLDVV